MSYLRSAAVRLSQKEVSPTCPDIDAAMAKLDEVIKDKTGELREALENWIERALEAEDKIVDLEKEIEGLNETIAELESAIEQLGEGS